MKLLRRLNLSYRLFLLIALCAVGLLVYGSWSFRTLDQLKVNGPLYAEIMESKDLIADALPPPLFIIESYLVCLQMGAPNTMPAQVAELEMRLGQLREAHLGRLRHWAAEGDDPQLTRLNASVGTSAAAFYDLAYAQMIPALHRGDRASLAQALTAMGGAYEQHRRAVDLLVAHAASNTTVAEATAATRVTSDTARLRLILLATLIVSVTAAVLIRRSITGPLAEALGVAQRVAAGDMRPHGHAKSADEPGQLLDALDTMSASLASMLEERASAEQSLRRAKELTERLIASANVVIVGLDREGRVVIFNQTASTITGYAAEQVMGRAWRTLGLLAPDDAAQWPAHDGWDTVRLAHEQAIVTASGARRYLAWQSTVLGDEGGEVALISFGIDVSDQRAALDATVKAQQAAEAATRSKSEFLANMSHEIRTPMNAVIGMTRLALKTDLDARQRNYLEKVDRAAHGLLGIINDILDFSKIEAGKLRFEQRHLELRQTLDHLAGMTVYRAQEKGLELLFDIGPGVPLAMTGDPLRLGQVLLNLVNNAIKFTEHGEIVVAIRMHEPEQASTDGELTLLFEVRDSGIGITPEQAGRLFSAFAQADASTTRTHGGTGLGLAISRKLVDMMGGRLWLEPMTGPGSCFRFTARFGQPAQVERLPARIQDLAALKVLVVDDNAAARDIMLNILTSMAMRPASVDSAASAIVALEQAESDGDPYAMVLMDWMMPGMDGLSAIRAIRANPAIAATLSIIMITAYSRDDLVTQAGDLARLDVLEKPVTPSSVLDAIVNGLYQDSGAAIQVAVAPRRGLAEALVTLAGASVLLVEDNDVNQELAVDILTALGLNVSVAGNGLIALGMLETQQFDAILMDCQMPVMDGFEATRRIRSQARLAHVPILAMTANAMSGDRERCLAAGMNEHISKPINQDALAVTLARWIAPALARPMADAAAARAAQMPALRAAGVNVDAALGRVHGNLRAYQQQLARLQNDFEAQIAEALAQGATERATRLAHHVQGLSANVGAEAITYAAAAVHRAIAAGSGTDPALATLAERLTRLRQAMDADRQAG